MASEENQIFYFTSRHIWSLPNRVPKGNHRDKSLENLEFKRGKKKKDLVFTGLQTSQTNTSYHIQYQTQVGKKLSEPISHDSY